MGEHWYDRDGRPRYEVASKNGWARATTLADARKHAFLPSVTTCLSVIDKPALGVWKVKQGILAALTLPRDPAETEEAYLARVLSDSGEQAKAAAEEGTRIHDACECAVKGKDYDPKYRPHVLAAVAEINRLFPEVSDWVAEKSFGSPLGYGGKVDLHSPSTGIVIDYKSTDEKAGSTKKFHWDQHYQLAAYQRGLCLPINRCANIFVSRTEPGVVFSHVWSVKEIEEGWDVFKNALALWVSIKKYNPAWSEQAAA